MSEATPEAIVFQCLCYWAVLKKLTLNQMDRFAHLQPSSIIPDHLELYQIFCLCLLLDGPSFAPLSFFSELDHLTSNHQGGLVQIEQSHGYDLWYLQLHRHQEQTGD
jgi:hypothetical protein